MLLSVSDKTQLLNCKGFAVLKFSLGFVVKFAFLSSISLSIANSFDNKPRVSLVCIATIPNRSLFIEIKRHRSYIDDSIESFSL